MNNFNAIDFKAVKEIVSQYAAIPDAKQRIIEEDILFNPISIKNKLNLTQEALLLLNKDFRIAFDGIENNDLLLEKADKGSILEGVELARLLCLHNHVIRIKYLFKNVDHEYELFNYIDVLITDNQIFGKITKAIDNFGNVKEDASPKLRDINYELDRSEKNLYNSAHSFISKHSGSLQEQSLYLRNNRVTFLVRNSDKNKFDGYTYGTSASGQAFYVEPSQFIELNNRVLQLEDEREEEIHRILRELSYLVASVSDLYRRDFDSLVELNMIFAKAYYGFYHHGIIAQISDDNYLGLEDIAHPLIPEDRVVSNSYHLYNEYQGIVISGSNTGGKTVSLKLIGLAVLLSYIGIPLLAHQAVIPFFDRVYIDIDDNQSINDSLSTFSAHISNIDNIFKNASSKSLILIDELISGTDPKEAQAISLAILEKIKEIGSRFVITTHYDDIKNYSYKDPTILLSSVSFDYDTLSPTYHYLENSVGSSNAIDIAARYLSDKKILDNARHFMNQSKRREDELMEKLGKQIDENEKLKLELNQRINENNNNIQKYQELISSFEKEKADLKEKYLKELNEYIEDVKFQAEEKLESINDKKDTIKVQQISKLQVEEVKTHHDDVFTVGDNVKVGEGDQIGVIESINGNNVEVIIRGIKVKTKLNNLKKMPKNVQKKKKGESKKYKNYAKEINLIGQRVEEALLMMEPFLDTAYGSGASSVKIIHGIGTGQLRTGIRSKLKKLRFVADFHDGDFYDGGSAVTIVEFKK